MKTTPTRTSTNIIAVALALATLCWGASASRAEDARGGAAVPKATTKSGHRATAKAGQKAATAAGQQAAAKDASKDANKDSKPASEMIQVEYVPPKNPAHQGAYEMVQQRRTLEKLREVFSPLRLPVPVTIRTIGCDGVSNAWYQRENDRPTLSICYEYLVEVWQTMVKETTAAGTTPEDAVVGQLFFAMAHEFGHAAFDIFDIPVFGREEDAADQFATYIMLQVGDDRAHRLITGAAFSYREFIRNYKEKPNVTLPLLAFSSDHGSPEQRFYNLLCLAYGYDSKIFADVVEQGFLPQTRARNCRYEYVVLRYAFRQLIVPHLNMDLAKTVMDARWLDDSNVRPKNALR
jgi:hypothetical protein